MVCVSGCPMCSCTAAKKTLLAGGAEAIFRPSPQTGHVKPSASTGSPCLHGSVLTVRAIGAASGATGDVSATFPPNRPNTHPFHDKRPPGSDPFGVDLAANRRMSETAHALTGTMCSQLAQLPAVLEQSPKRCSPRASGRTRRHTGAPELPWRLGYAVWCEDEASRRRSSERRCQS